MRLSPGVLLIAAAIAGASLPAIAESDSVEAVAVGGSEPAPPPALPDSSDADIAEIPSAPIPAAAERPQTPVLTDLTTAPTSLWQRIRNGFGLPDIATPLVHEQEERFANSQDYFKSTIARSSRYLYHIVSEVEKRGMPSEIALLPIIESAYNPVAYSRAHASGIWQFIPSTGRRYGLQQNFWYDGRRDVIAATNAALDYLEELYEMFGSWDLALAAYNWGEGAVSRGILKNLAKGLPTDYQNLNMPRETRYYIPKLQAVKNIIANPAQYGIELAEIPNEPYFVAVTTTKHIDVKLAASFANVPIEEFVSLNPAYSRPVIRASGEQTLLVPTGKAETFRLNLESHDRPLVSWQAYKLKAGDSISGIAARHGISVSQLKQVNDIGGKSHVGPGSTLLVPGRASATPHLPDLPAPQMAVAKTAKKPVRYAKSKGGVVKVAQTRNGSAAIAKTMRKTTPKKPATAAAKTETGSPKTIVLAQQPR